MGATVRIKPLAQTFSVSGAAGPQIVAEVHRARVAEALAIDAAALGHVPPSTTFVNGLRSDALEQVKPGQAIVTTFDLASDMLQHIWDLLIVNAPSLTGRFQRSIKAYADGREVEDLNEAVGAKEVVFTSTVPYARKIERGESDQAPDGVFEAVAAIASRRYGNQASIKFTFANPVGGVASDLAKWSAGRGELSRREQQRDTRQPAITVTFR